MLKNNSAGAHEEMNAHGVLKKFTTEVRDAGSSPA